MLAKRSGYAGLQAACAWCPPEPCPVFTQKLSASWEQPVIHYPLPQPGIAANVSGSYLAQRKEGQTPYQFQVDADMPFSVQGPEAVGTDFQQPVGINEAATVPEVPGGARPSPGIEGFEPPPHFDASSPQLVPVVRATRRGAYAACSLCPPVQCPVREIPLRAPAPEPMVAPAVPRVFPPHHYEHQTYTQVGDEEVSSLPMGGWAAGHVDDELDGLPVGAWEVETISEQHVFADDAGSITQARPLTKPSLSVWHVLRAAARSVADIVGTVV